MVGLRKGGGSVLGRGPWFILSAEHGLVAPDEWFAPYERCLPGIPVAYHRTAWAAWVAARLELIVGPIRDKTIDIHAGADCLDVVRPQLEAWGATVVDPLQGLSMGERLARYGASESIEVMSELDDQSFADRALG